MGDRMTVDELLTPNDLLLQDDRLPQDDRLEWLHDRMGDFDLAYAFGICARGEDFRGLLELQ